MNNFQLLSPVLYFFAGGFSDDSIELIKNIQSKLITNNKGIQYVSNISELQSAHTAFLKTPFNTVGEIRVNFVVNTNSPDSCHIDQTIEAAYNFLRLRYTTYVTVDAYCILDESGGDFELMSASLNSLENLRDKNLNIVYLLSNINNKGIANDNNKNIFESIAYMPLVLDCAIVKDIQGGWFDERYFKQLSKGSQCYTIGSLVLQKPVEAIYNESAINIINYLNEILSAGTETAEHYAKRLVTELKINFDTNIKIEEEDMFALLENSDKGIDKLIGFTNYELILNSFGERLDAFFDLNITEQSQAVYETSLTNISKNITLILDEAAKDPKCGIFGLTKTINCFDKEILDTKKDYENNHQKSNTELEAWKASTSRFHKKTIAPFSKKYRLPYETAYTYIKLKSNELNQRLNTALLNQTISIIQCYYAETKYKADALIYLQAELRNKNTKLLNNQLPVITHSFTKYYNRLTYKYIQANEKRLQKIYSDFYYQNAKETEKSILEYAKNVVASEPFSKSLVDEINDRVSKNRAIYDSGISGKNYNIYLRSGESGKHREICLFTNNPSDFSHYAKEQGVSPEFDKLNIMYGLDKSQIILIYMLGVFSTEDLFYRELYISANK